MSLTIASIAGVYTTINLILQLLDEVVISVAGLFVATAFLVLPSEVLSTILSPG